jgi:choline dehydrogenase-like flavoprotein
MGGVIMGNDPGASVCTSHGQTHDIPNLFVAGSSLFPTSGAVNPTFTIHAVTTRSAEWIDATWGAIV